ncbi:MAG: ATP-grasp domain-containing protein [Flavobacteriaceae bacterium]
MNILFTCAGRRNYLVNYFKEALNGQGKVIAVDSQLSAPALVESDIKIQVPPVNHREYLDVLKDIIVDNKVHAVISLNDLELPVLAKNKKELEIWGAKVLVSDEHIIDISFDKWKTYQFFKENNIQTLLSFISLDDALQSIKEGKLEFPVVVKPRWGSASSEINIVESTEELILSFELLKKRIIKSQLNHIKKADEDRCVIIQERSEGEEYGMDVLNDFDGKYYGTFVRKKLAMRAGETDKAVSVINPKLSKLGKYLSSATGHIGNMDCDFFVRDNEIYMLEMNPRFGGGYPFSHEAGINIPAIYIAWLNGQRNVGQFNNYKANQVFSKCDRLLSIPKEEILEGKTAMSKSFNFLK